MFYFILLTSAITLSYFFIPLILSHILNLKAEYRNINKLKVLKSLILITLFSVAVFLLSGLFNDTELSNRFLHSMGGGFNIVLVMFFCIRDFKIKINRLQYIILALLIVTFFGVINEIIEYVFQLLFNLIFNSNIYDTWLDLISNLIGTVIGILFTNISLTSSPIDHKRL